MGKISVDTFRRLVLLRLVGSFKDGVYGNFRMQKVLYFAEAKSGVVPFPFKHTALGQYSEDLRDVLEQLASMGFVQVTPLPNSDLGNRYALAEGVDGDAYRTLLQRLSPPLSTEIDASVAGLGYRKWQDLKDYAHRDPVLAEVPMDECILPVNVADVLEFDLDEDECEDLALSLDPRFISAADRIASAIETTEFDLSRVETVASIC
jgi:hypothetical protein